MAFNPGTGQTLDGKQLPTLPPNSSNEEQTVIINDIINVLNNYSRDVVLSGSGSLAVLAGQFFVVKTIPHNLGYKPQAYVYLNDQTVSHSDGTNPDVVIVSADVPLPSPINYSADGLGHILFTDFMTYFVDSVNLYVLYTAGVTYDGDNSHNFRYYLTRNPAS